jgi:predicted nucleic acid-binding protein
LIVVAGVVVLDSEAVASLARPSERTASTRRAQAVLAVAARRGALVRVPSVVLAELYRDDARDGPIDRLLSAGIGVVTTGRRIARVAGGLLRRHRLDSCHLADAVVIATAARLGEAVVLTGDPDDLRRLAAGHPNIEVVALP